jgi:hypothetical protein
MPRTLGTGSNRKAHPAFQEAYEPPQHLQPAEPQGLDSVFVQTAETNGNIMP